MKIEIIPTKGWLYDKCENMEQLYDKYYYPLLVENKNLKSQIEYLRRSIERKEETITELELERVPYTNEYVEKVKKENEDLKRQLEEYKENYQEELDENSKLSELWCDSRAKIRELERQLEYLRSGEYYNQLRFENKMLQDVVDNGEVSKEDKAFIDMTHRNTELLEENKKLKERIDYLERSNNRREELILELREELIPSKGDNEDE
jgi:uncharacterized protein (DUF3084 family)